MRYRFIYAIIFFLVFPNIVGAIECSPSGYTITTINGIFTNKREAEENLNELINTIHSDFYNNQPLDFQYLYNPSHLAGAGDLIDVIQQGLFDQESDYDLMEMLNDASDKVKTQKLLLIGHSQGNFYANNLYDKTASQPGGIPSHSIGVYGVGSPASRVGGGGKYITSDTDKVIAAQASRYMKILKPNIHIALEPADGNGHSFSDVYLKYQGDRIVSDIKSSLNKLKENDEQIPEDPCIYPPELTTLHKIQGTVLALADPAANVAKTGVVVSYKAGVYVRDVAGNTGMALGNMLNKIIATGHSRAKDLPASVIESSPKPNKPTTVIADNTQQTVAQNNPKPEQKQEQKPEDTNTKLALGNESLSAKKNTVDTTSKPKSQSKRRSGGGGTAAPQQQNTPPEDNNNGENADLPENDDEENTDSPEESPPDDELPTEDIIPPVITIIGDNPEIVAKGYTYTDPGVTALDDVDGELDVSVSSDVDTSVIGFYTVIYTATDLSGNVATEERNVEVTTYKYIPKYSFGKNNGDGNNWQVWSFNGSNIYDWFDTYVDHYLREQFKIQTQRIGVYCGLCLERGIFNHDPQKGFEITDVAISGLENTPQNNMDETIYRVKIQWDSSGYTYTISHGSTIDATGHTDIENVNENMWVGWDGSYNHFKTFPSGSWDGTPIPSLSNRRGGFDMILQPYKVYDPSQISSDPDPDPDTTPDPDPDADSTLPTIVSYTFNEVEGDITVDPATNPLALLFTASENVDWVSIQIEDENNPEIYKIFFPGVDCDTKDTCAEIWDGALSSGGELADGTFHIKIHIKDVAENEYFDYLSPHKIIVDVP